MGYDEQPDYYEILGIARSATSEEITRAYRKTMRAVHPDTSGTTGLFRLVKTAHETLKDPLARAAYDARGPAAPPSPPPAPPPPSPPPGPPPPDPHGPRSPWSEGPDAPGGASAAGDASASDPWSNGASWTKGDPWTKAAPWKKESRWKKAARRRRPEHWKKAAFWRKTALWKKVRPDAGPKAGATPATGQTIRVRPRFGAHWTLVAATAVWCLVCLIAVYVLWPARLPLNIGLLLLLPVVAAPIISTQPALRSRTWPWAVCVAIFALTAVLTALDAGVSDSWALCLALGGLFLAGAGLAAGPYIVRRGRELDSLVGPDSLGYQVFNIPGAGLTSAAARHNARASAEHLEGLHSLPGTRIVHSLVPPQLPGQARCHVDHAVLRDNRLALVMVRCWPAATYTWSDRGALLADGQRFAGGDTGITGAVKSMRSVVPRGVQVRGFVYVQPDGLGQDARFEEARTARGTAFAGSPAQVYGQLTQWLGEAEPVLHRRMFAALLPHVRRPEGD